MKIIYKDSDITESVAVTSCIHKMHSAGRSDTLCITFDDSEGIWGRWDPMPGDIIQVEDGAANTGKMSINRIYPQNGAIMLLALSCPSSGFELRSRSWSQVTLHQLIFDIAEQNNLSVELYDIEDYTYSYINQDLMGDFEFLDIRLTLEGYAFTVFNDVMIVYNEYKREQVMPLIDIDISADMGFEYRDKTSSLYGISKIESGIYSGSFNAQNGSDRLLNTPLNVEVSSGPECNRFAKSLLRNVNKDLRTGTFDYELVSELSAASTINIINENSSSWNGSAFIYEQSNNYISEKSRISIRKPLEGY